MNNKSLYKKTFGMQLNKFTIAILLFLFTLLIFNIKFRYVGSGDTKPNELLPISIIYERDFDFNEFVSEQRATALLPQHPR